MHFTGRGVFDAVLTGLLVFAALFLFFLISIIRYQREKVKLYRQRLNTEINSLERERLRIAKDLHDDLGATLSAVKIRLQCLKPDNEENIVLIEQSQHYIDDAMQRLRRISLNMMPQILQRNGLEPALEELLDMLLASTDIKVTANYALQIADTEAGLHIYRLIQEIITNVIKHANATLITIDLKKQSGEIYLRITDNGVGFNKKLFLKNNHGQGLKNIIARKDILNAKMYVSTGPGQGTAYLIKIPEKYGR